MGSVFAVNVICNELLNLFKMIKCHTYHSHFIVHILAEVS